MLIPWHRPSPPSSADAAEASSSRWDIVRHDKCFSIVTASPSSYHYIIDHHCITICIRNPSLILILKKYSQRLLRGRARHNDNDHLHQWGGRHALPRLHPGGDGGVGGNWRWWWWWWWCCQWCWWKLTMVLVVTLVIQTCTDSADSEPFSTRGRLGLRRRGGRSRHKGRSLADGQMPSR